MSPHVILLPGARANLQTIARWYRHQDVDLARRFEAQVAATLVRIARHPKSFVLVDDVTHRALLTRFPYSIYFTVEANTVFVLRIRHQRRAGIRSAQRGNNWQVDDE